MHRRTDNDGHGPDLRARLARPDLTERLGALREALERTAASAWLVGGTVRDLMLDAPRIADLDVVTDGDSVEIARSIAAAQNWAFVLLDQSRGTARVVTPGREHIDVNALVGGSIEADLRQRDITINALALRIGPEGVDPALIDVSAGAADLGDGLIRLTSEAAAVDDPLRLLRVFRFSTTLGFTIVPETRAILATHAPLLRGVAAERIVAELVPILLDTGSTAVLRRMDEVGLLEAVLPELAGMKGVEQNDYHHLDVFEHSLSSLDRFERLLGDLPSVFGAYDEQVEGFLDADVSGGRPRMFAVKLAVLLHDIGKPPTRSTEQGRTTFYHHNTVGSDLAAEACRRLRLSGAETDEVAFYVHAHMVPGDVEKTVFEAGEDASTRSVLRFVARRGEQGLVLALIAVADSMAMAGALADPDRPERLRRFARRAAAAYYEDVRPNLEHPPLLGGAELMRELDIEPGPEVGAVLDRLRQLQITGAIRTRDDALRAAAAALAETRSAAGVPEPAAEGDG